MKGIVIDSIDVLSAAGNEDQNFGDREKDWLSTILYGINISAQEEGILKIISESVQSYHRHLYFTQKLIDTNFISKQRELAVISVQDNPILSGYLHSLVCGRFIPRERWGYTELESFLKLEDLSLPTPGPFAAKTTDSLDAGIRLRRLAITKKEYIGAAPHEAQIGDLICVLYGCSVPVILRPISDDSELPSNKAYRFIGECYLHGFMDAEAIAWQIKGELEEDEFVLI